MCATIISGTEFKDPFKFEQKNAKYKVAEASDGDQNDEIDLADID
jgi:hypothetical protein